MNEVARETSPGSESSDEATRQRRRAAMLRAVAPLVRDMRQALRSELGSYSLYSLLPRVVRNAEVRRLLAELRRDEVRIIEQVGQTIEEFGGRAERSRWTRSAAAWLIVAATPVIGLRFALRLCYEAESTVSRWYAEYAAFLAGFGDYHRAVRFTELSTQKRLHATRLSTFVANLPLHQDDEHE